MYCVKCEAKIEHDGRFCHSCGAPLSNSATQNTSISGDQSFNGGQNNVIIGNNISIEDKSSAEPVAYIDRVKITPIAIGGHPLKVTWVILSGTLSALASIATIWSTWGTTYQFLGLLLLAISITALLTGITLIRSKFVRLHPFTNLESNNTGEIFSTKIGGNCPKCNGDLKLKEVGPKNNKFTIVRCARNTNHFWNFDPTVLDDL